MNNRGFGSLQCEGKKHSKDDLILRTIARYTLSLMHMKEPGSSDYEIKEKRRENDGVLQVARMKKNARSST